MANETPSQPLKTRRRWRKWLFAAVFVVTAARLALVEGWWTPIRIIGPSMAPYLHGQHAALTCERCSFVYRFDTELQPAPSLLRCPNCGHWHDASVEADTIAGDRVWIDRWPMITRPLKRMDVVAFTAPRDQTLAVKRVIGLPGEELEFRGGEIHIDGQLWQKTLAEHRLCSRLVHDGDCISTSQQGLPPPWQAENGKWKYSTERRSFVVDRQTSQQLHWLSFATTIDDNDAYNPAVKLPASDVHDVRVTTEVRSAGAGKFACRLRDGWHEWLLKIDLSTARLTLLQDGERVTSAPLDFDPCAFTWETAIVDQQLFVVIDGQEVLRHAYVAPGQARGPMQWPVEIGAQDAAIELVHLRLYRDVFWLDPVGLSKPWKCARLGRGEYFLLGDNVPVSTDSRHFGPVARSVVRGVVKPSPLP